MRLLLLCALLSSCLLCSSVARADEPLPAPPPPPPATLDKMPKLLHFVEAEPPASLAERRQVDVLLTIDVDDTGKIGAVSVAKSGGEEYDAAALAAARQFQFAPGEAGGKPVSVRITYQYRFTFKEPPPPAPAAPTDGSAATTPAAPAVDTVPLDGVVRQKGEREPIPGVSVAVDDQVALTDDKGAFHFDALPVGEHAVKLRGSDIIATDLKLTLKPKIRLEVTWFVGHRERFASVVRAQRVVQETVEHTISGDELRHIPGTQGDTLKAVQTLAGV
ncbi:MAG TPA: TonB family protein, partial [Polyangia bacterium]|nr:TonB family protein [Polyangia bacterium]